MQHAYLGVAEGLRAEIEGSPPQALPGVGQRLWQAVAAGEITDHEAEHLDALLRSRTAPSDAIGGPRTAAVPIGQLRSVFPVKRRQRAPERLVLIERRRASAASGWLPPAIAKRFTTSEQSVLAVVVREIVMRGCCELCVDAVAALAGCSRRMVQGALRLAHDTGILLIEERRRRGDRNLTNRVTILSRELAAWAKRRGGGGCRSSHPMSRQIQNPTATVQPGVAGIRLSEGPDRYRGGSARSGTLDMNEKKFHG